jgi:WD40 repeat protein
MMKRAACMIILAVLCIVRGWANAQQSAENLVFLGRSPRSEVLIFGQQNEVWLYDENMQRVGVLDLRLPDASTNSAADRVAMSWSASGDKVAALIDFSGLLNQKLVMTRYVMIWDTRTWTRLSTIDGLYYTRNIDLSPSGDKLAADIHNIQQAIALYDTSSGTKLKVIPLQTKQVILGLAWNPLNVDQLVVGVNSTLLVLNPNAGVITGTLGPYNGDVPPIFNPATGQLAVITLDYKVDIYDLKTDQRVRTISADSDIYVAGWLSDGLITRQFDDTLQLWDINTGTSRVLSRQRNVGAWSFDLKTYVSWNDEGYFLHDAKTGKVIAQLLKSAPEGKVSNTPTATGDTSG